MTNDVYDCPLTNTPHAEWYKCNNQGEFDALVTWMRAKYRQAFRVRNYFLLGSKKTTNVDVKGRRIIMREKSAVLRWLEEEYLSLITINLKYKNESHPPSLWEGREQGDIK